MTHAELRARLRAYADGTLADPDAEVVRGHLATGCEQCLRDVFGRGVGLPRPRPIVVVSSRRGRTVGLIVAAAGLGVLAGATVGTLRYAATVADRHTLAPSDDVAQLRAERSLLADKVRALEGEVAGAGARTAQIRAELEGTRARLAEVERRVPEPPPAAAERVPDVEVPPAWLDELLSSGGARGVPLRAAPFARDARGYALWSPGRGIVVVTASGLPPGDAPVTYRARVSLDDRSTVWVGDLGATERGSLTVTIALPHGADRRVTAVDLYRDPPGTPALTARWRP